MRPVSMLAAGALMACSPAERTSTTIGGDTTGSATVGDDTAVAATTDGAPARDAGGDRGAATMGDTAGGDAGSAVTTTTGGDPDPHTDGVGDTTGGAPGNELPAQWGAWFCTAAPEGVSNGYKVGVQIANVALKDCHGNDVEMGAFCGADATGALRRSRLVPAL